MYADLSIVQKKDLEISHLLRKLPEDHVNVVCIDWVFHDEVLPKVNVFLLCEIADIKAGNRECAYIHEGNFVRWANCNPASVGSGSRCI